MSMARVEWVKSMTAWTEARDVTRSHRGVSTPMTCLDSCTTCFVTPAIMGTSRLRKKGKALSRSVWSLNCLGGIRHVIGQFE